MRPACTIQSPALRQLSSSRLPCAATRLTSSTRPTNPPPGAMGIDQPESVRPQMKKLRMYALTAPRVPMRTCASVHATTRIINRARQTMVSLREVSPSQRRDAILVKVEALQEVDEVWPGRRHRTGIADHLHEPGVALKDQHASDHPALRRALAGEVVERKWARLGGD